MRSSRESLDRERQMMPAVSRGVARFEPLRGKSESAASDRFRAEQKHAVVFVVFFRDTAFRDRYRLMGGLTGAPPCGSSAGFVTMQQHPTSD
jgi:hypothetical protein